MSCRFVKVCVCLELEREETLDSFVNRLEQPGLAQDEEIEEMLPDIASWARASRGTQDWKETRKMAWLSVFRLAPGDNLHRHNKARIFLSLINRCRPKIEINMKMKYILLVLFFCYTRNISGFEIRTKASLYLQFVWIKQITASLREWEREGEEGDLMI